MPTTGKDSYFSIEDSAATTLRNISPYVNSVDFNQTADMLETSTYGAEGKTYVPGLTNSTFTVAGLWDKTASTGSATVFDSLIGLDDITVGFEYGPAGNATGAVKYSGECVLASIAYSDPVGGLVTFSAQVQVSGVVSKGTF